MLMDIIALTGLTGTQFWICTAVVFTAGLVRGFSGFGLSAVVMAGIVTIIPPVDLIPVCYVLEAAASLALLRGNIRSADWTLVLQLALGSAIGVPIGLAATTYVAPETSKMIALLLVLTLTGAQLLKLVPPGFGGRYGTPAAGLLAGIVTGLASVGGLVVALYVLSRKTEPQVMRSSLIIFLLAGMVTTLMSLLYYELMTAQALQRGTVFVPVVLLGVFFGSILFSPKFAPYYKRACLTLLLCLSAVGVSRLL
ncbi:sulfite exporter TauE/SafE family protein [Labrenzia sp. PHM005]|nr:sulfite exporter TauE/SafE family protein [Labrenzia sp. PHM005]